MKPAAVLAMILLASCEQPIQTETITETVEVPAENVAPAVEIIGPATADNGQAVHYHAEITDPDDEAHYIAWSVDDSFVSLGPDLSVTRRPQAQREYTISVYVHDGRDEATDSLILTVAGPQWLPEALHVYTFPAELTEYSDEAIRDEYVFSEDRYDEMVGRVRDTVESHNRNNPDDQLQIVEGGKP